MVKQDSWGLIIGGAAALVGIPLIIISMSRPRQHYGYAAPPPPPMPMPSAPRSNKVFNTSRIANKKSMADNDPWDLGPNRIKEKINNARVYGGCNRC